MGQIPFNGKDKICPICGKQFMFYEETWVYKRRRKEQGTKYFCSYGCMNKYDLQHPKPIAVEQREAIIRMIRGGAKTSDIVRTLGVDRSKVRYWQERTAREVESE